MENLDLLLNKLESFDNEIKNTTDRSCIIVAAAYLDDLLRLLLEAFLVKGGKVKDSDLYDGNGPLSTFSSRIKLSYKLGLISEYECVEIEKVRKIRNSFAHQVLITSFDNDKVRGIVFQMKPKRELLPPKMIPLGGVDREKMEHMKNLEKTDSLECEILPKIPKIDMESARDRFEKTISCLVSNLMARIITAQNNVRTVPEDYNSILDVEGVKIFNQEIGLQRATAQLSEIEADFNKNIEMIEKDIESAQEKKDEKKKKRAIKKKDEILGIKENIRDLLEYDNNIRLILELQKYASNQIKKALEKEGLI